MKIHPRIETARLRLRPFGAEDAPLLAELAGSREIADTSIRLPHPFSPSTARSSIAAHAAAFQSGLSVHFAIEEKPARELIGAVELLDLDRDHARAELAFWIAPSAWGRGLASEAANAAVAFGFSDLALNRIAAQHLLRSPAAGAVLHNAGMKQEGVLRERVKKQGRFEDVALYAILRADRPAA